jgi:hypothetical protein
MFANPVAIPDGAAEPLTIGVPAASTTGLGAAETGAGAAVGAAGAFGAVSRGADGGWAGAWGCRAAGFATAACSTCSVGRGLRGALGRMGVMDSTGYLQTRNMYARSMLPPTGVKVTVVSLALLVGSSDPLACVSVPKTMPVPLAATD